MTTTELLRAFQAIQVMRKYRTLSVENQAMDVGEDRGTGEMCPRWSLWAPVGSHPRRNFVSK